jgi:hypothetical protein
MITVFSFFEGVGCCHFVEQKNKPICSDFVFSKCQMLISKKITEPICSDLVFKKCLFGFGQENYKPNCRLCQWLGAGFQEN